MPKVPPCKIALNSATNGQEEHKKNYIINKDRQRRKGKMEDGKSSKGKMEALTKTESIKNKDASSDTTEAEEEAWKLVTLEPKLREDKQVINDVISTVIMKAKQTTPVKRKQRVSLSTPEPKKTKKSKKSPEVMKTPRARATPKVGQRKFKSNIFSPEVAEYLPLSPSASLLASTLFPSAKDLAADEEACTMDKVGEEQEQLNGIKDKSLSLVEPKEVKDKPDIKTNQRKKQLRVRMISFDLNRHSIDNVVAVTDNDLVFVPQVETGRDTGAAPSTRGFNFPEAKCSKISKTFSPDSRQVASSPFVLDGAKTLKLVSNNLTSIDNLLKLPERPIGGGKTKEEILDEQDEQIRKNQKKHDEAMAKYDREIEGERRKKKEREQNFRANADLRDRLEMELPEDKMRLAVNVNIGFLQSIESGVTTSARHKAFHMSMRSREALNHRVITDPFTNDQLNWTLEELGKVWMRNKREQSLNKEYIWNVILAECLIKVFSDQFGVNRAQAEVMMAETPLLEEGESSSIKYM